MVRRKRPNSKVMLNLDSDEESKLSHEIIPRTFDLPVFKKDHTDLEKMRYFSLVILSINRIF